MNACRWRLLCLLLSMCKAVIRIPWTYRERNWFPSNSCLHSDTRKHTLATAFKTWFPRFQNHALHTWEKNTLKWKVHPSTTFRRFPKMATQWLLWQCNKITCDSTLDCTERKSSLVHFNYQCCWFCRYISTFLAQFYYIRTELKEYSLDNRFILLNFAKTKQNKTIVMDPEMYILDGCRIACDFWERKLQKSKCYSKQKHIVADQRIFILDVLSITF